MENILNLPSSAYDYEFIVARLVDDYFWYWGAYHDWTKASKVAAEIDGFVFHNH